MKILFISPAYYVNDPNRLPILPISLIEQSSKNWELVMMHDGKGPARTHEFIRSLKDNRIHYSETSVRRNDYGHPIRDKILRNLREPSYFHDVTHVCITNPDNYYMPGFTYFMSQPFQQEQNVIGVRCNKIIHNYTYWKVMDVKHECGSVDIGGVVLDRRAAAEVAWPWVDHSSDFTMMNEIHKKHGESSFRTVDACLFVHN